MQTLKEIKAILQDVFLKVEWSQQKVDNDMVRFTGIKSLKGAIDKLGQVNILAAFSQYLQKTSLYKVAEDEVSVKVQESAKISRHINELWAKAGVLIELLTELVPNEDANSINIKLPPVHDFDELSKVSRDIHISLTQLLVNDEINGQTKIVSVENGSIWLNVFVGGAGAMTLVASLTWSASVIYKKIQEGRLMAKQVELLGIKKESLEEVLNAQKAQTNLLIEAEAQYIQSQHFNNDAPENIERIKHSIKTLAELIDKGAEIHPALVAPENVANLFPDPTKMLGIESKIKKLTEPSDN